MEITREHAHTRPSGECRLQVDGRAVTFDWGRFDAPGSPSFWVDQTWRRGYVERVDSAARSADLRDELVFCLLGGYGVTAEVAGATFRQLQQRLDLDRAPTVDELRVALHEPISTSSGRPIRYRFWRQRAARISAALSYLAESPPPSEPLDLRDWLLGAPGVGPKTASWIVRNTTGSSQVAIIDIWLARALTRAGVFPPEWSVERHYSQLEHVFLGFAHAGQVPAAALDWCIWETSRWLLPCLDSQPR